jgi:hypothetical protein
MKVAFLAFKDFNIDSLETVGYIPNLDFQKHCEIVSH